MIHPDKPKRLWDILILGVFDRDSSALINRIRSQLTDEVGLIVLSDNLDYEVGYKRTQLVNLSEAKYVSFVDDDDMVSENYVERVLEAITEDHDGNLEPYPDMVGFEIEYLQNGKPNKENKPIRIAPKYPYWKEDEEAWWRDIYHLAVVKHSIASRFSFKGMRKEDANWANDIRNAGLINTVRYINECLYTYDKTDKSLTRRFLR